MSRRHSHGRGSGRRRGPVKRVIRGLADAFGIPRGVVIAGFVLGFISAPLLTLLVCLAALYWVDHPERVRRYADTAYDSFKRTTDRLWCSLVAPQPRGVGGGLTANQTSRRGRPRTRGSRPAFRKDRAAGAHHRGVRRLRGVPPQPRIPADGARVGSQALGRTLPRPGEGTSLKQQFRPTPRNLISRLDSARWAPTLAISRNEIEGRPRSGRVFYPEARPADSSMAVAHDRNAASDAISSCAPGDKLPLPFDVPVRCTRAPFAWSSARTSMPPPLRR